jgi:L-rhamnonate dehydratase
MSIQSVNAKCYRVPVELPLGGGTLTRPVVLVTVTTADGLEGFGLTSGTPDLVTATAEFVNTDLADFAIGADPITTDSMWDKLRQRFNNRNLTGVWSAGVSAFDIALWDIKGQSLGQPVYRLLGGHSSRVDTYVTFGIAQYSTAELIEVGRSLVDDGHSALKIVVGGFSEDDYIASEKPVIRSGFDQVRHDAARVWALREALGPDVDIIIDGNFSLDIHQAKALCKSIEDAGILWFEEPVRGNDARLLRELRSNTSVPIGAGQNIGHHWAHLDLMYAGAVDLVMPNVCYVGGFSSALKVAHTAESFNLPLAHGGGWPHHNMHLHAAVPNGGMLELHWSFWKSSETLFEGGPSVDGSGLVLSDAPGLGIRPRQEISELSY